MCSLSRVPWPTQWPRISALCAGEIFKDLSVPSEIINAFNLWTFALLLSALTQTYTSTHHVYIPTHHVCPLSLSHWPSGLSRVLVPTVGGAPAALGGPQHLQQVRAAISVLSHRSVSWVFPVGSGMLSRSWQLLPVASHLLLFFSHDSDRKATDCGSDDLTVDLLAAAALMRLISPPAASLFTLNRSECLIVWPAKVAN